MRSTKPIRFPCYGPRCHLCKYAPWRNTSNNICQDFRKDRPFVDLKPWGYKPDGRRYWRFS